MSIKIDMILEDLYALLCTVLIDMMYPMVYNSTLHDFYFIMFINDIYTCFSSDYACISINGSQNWQKMQVYYFQ